MIKSEKDYGGERARFMHVLQRRTLRVQREQERAARAKQERINTAERFDNLYKYAMGYQIPKLIVTAQICEEAGQDIKKATRWLYQYNQESAGFGGTDIPGLPSVKCGVDETSFIAPDGRKFTYGNNNGRSAIANDSPASAKRRWLTKR